MDKIVNFVINFEDSTYTAEAVGFNIVTQADSLDDLVENIKDAMALYFEDQSVKSPYFSIIYSPNLETHA